MDYEAEIDVLKAQVTYLRDVVRILLKHHTVYLPVIISGDSRHNGGTILPEGLEMVQGEDDKFHPYDPGIDTEIQLRGFLEQSISLHNFVKGGTEDKLVRLKLSC